MECHALLQKRIFIYRDWHIVTFVESDEDYCGLIVLGKSNLFTYSDNIMVTFHYCVSKPIEIVTEFFL